MATRIVTTRMPTKYGAFQLAVYNDGKSELNHLALIKAPELTSQKAPLVRIHSECLTGDIFASLRCDCGDQLDDALMAISKDSCGVLIYLRQEGRGIGLVNKMHAYNLQDKGMDTVEANVHLGFEPDQRDYSIAVDILLDLNISAIRLLTNNPDKISAFDEAPIQVAERVPLQVAPNKENKRYLETKLNRFNHILESH